MHLGDIAVESDADVKLSRDVCSDISCQAQGSAELWIFLPPSLSFLLSLLFQGCFSLLASRMGGHLVHKTGPLSSVS